MSDLAATNCGCGGCGSPANFNGCGNNSCIWLILILIFCGGCGGSGVFANSGCGCDDGCGGPRGGCGGCDNSCFWIILILLFCCNC